MSHPDPDNTLEDDMDFDSNYDYASYDDGYYDANYDDHDDFYGEDGNCEDGPTTDCGCINCATWWTY